MRSPLPTEIEALLKPAKLTFICVALTAKMVTKKQVMEARGLSAEELNEWVSRFMRSGSDGLKVTRRVRGGRAV